MTVVSDQHAVFVLSFILFLAAPGGTDLEAEKDSTAIALDWQAPPACPRETEFIERLQRTVGRSLARRRDAAMRIAVAVEATASGEWIAQTRLQHGEDSVIQSTTARACTDVVDVAVLTTATFVLTHLDAAPSAEADPPPQDRPARLGVADERSLPVVGHVPPGTPTSTSRMQDEQVNPRAVEPKPKSSLHVAAWAHGGAVWGLGPRWGGLVGAGVALGPPLLSFEFAGHYRFGTDSASIQGIYLRGRSAFATAVALWAPQIRRLGLRLGAGIGLGAAVADGRGDLSVRHRDATLWIAAVAQAGLLWPLSHRLALRLMASVTVGRRPAFFVQTPSDDLVFRAYPRVAGLLTIGVHFSLR